MNNKNTEIGIFFIIALLAAALIQFSFPRILGVDGYYHIKFAYLMRTEGIIDNFYWAAHSIWAQNFSDKEFFYHVLLIPFTYMKNLELAAKISVVIFAGIALTSFFVVLKLNNIRFPWFWTFSLLLAPGFIERLNYPRAHVLSIIAMIWFVSFLIRKNLIGIVVISVLYPLTYTAFHLPIAVSMIFSAATFIFSKRFDYKTPIICLIAVLFGNLIHPNFPNNLYIFFVQNFVVPFNILYDKSPLDLATEFQPLSTKQFIFQNFTLVVGMMSVFVLSFFGRPKPVSIYSKNLMVLAICFSILTLFSERFTEYAVPISTLAFAFYTNEFIHGVHFNKISTGVIKTYANKAAIIGFLLLVGIANSYLQTTLLFKKYSWYGNLLVKTGEFLKKEVPTDNVIYTCNWDITPLLFFEDHSHRYEVFLDPSYMYYWNRDFYFLWDKVGQGKYGDDTYKALKDGIGVSYGVCLKRTNKALEGIIEKDPRISIVYEDKYAYIFKLS